ncbi:MAG: xanthine dehydrogenase family protein molybdopterin-binding subunit [Acidimicrobiia bacterium]|nr:xanthine dehydrogenase family protein molybdopterin-binding subunit [Acidimicrobiia bacterium]
MSILGNRVVRREDPALLTVGGTYVDDIVATDAAHVVYVRSTIAHGAIVSIDVTEARSAPGVLDVVTADDIDLGSVVPLALINASFARPLLARGRVRYVGEPIAAVVAESRAAAVDAAELVVVDIDPLPAVVAVADALADDAPVLFGPAVDSNVAMRIDAAGDPIDFDVHDVVVRLTTVNQRLAPAPIENRSALARWEDGRLVLEIGCQGAHPVRAVVAAVYGMEEADIRVICPDVGGGFGAKSQPAPEALLLGELSRRLGRPVRWSETRSENLTGMGHGRAQVQTVTLAGSADGDLQAYAIDILCDGGAYPGMGAILPFATRIMASGVYDIADVRVSSNSVATNTTPTGAYRGAGRPEATAAIERAVDLFAHTAGLDPIEVRRRNFIRPEQFPFTTPTGTVYDVGDYEGALDRAVAAADVVALRAEQQRRRDAGDPKLLGIGVSAYVEITAPGAGGEYGSVELLPGGRARVVTGSTPYGQGHDTAWSMLVTERTGIDMDMVEVVHGDTDFVPHSEVTGGSRSAQLAGSAVYVASGNLVDLARGRAADLLEAATDDIVLDTDTGRFHVAGTPARDVGWADIAASLDDTSPLIGLSDFASPSASFPFGVHIAVVEVDTETGRVDLQRFVACDDAGTILNPLLADGQVHGGLAQGVSQALFEEMRFDEDGNPLTATLIDYAVPSAAEFPMFERIQMETPTPLNPLGAKGIGESGTVGATPAVQNAVVDALLHLGVTHIDMPLSPERVWRAINGN